MSSPAWQLGEIGGAAKTPATRSRAAPTALPRRTCKGGLTRTSNSLIEFAGEVCPARAGGGFLARLRVARKRGAYHERARFAHHADVVDFPNAAAPLHVDHRVKAGVGLQFRRAGHHAL